MKCVKPCVICYTVLGMVLNFNQHLGRLYITVFLKIIKVHDDSVGLCCVVIRDNDTIIRESPCCSCFVSPVCQM